MRDGFSRSWGVPSREPKQWAAPSVFYTNAGEIKCIPGIHVRTNCCRGLDRWFDVGLQVLYPSGWRVNTSRPLLRISGKRTPPRNIRGVIVIRSRGRMRRYPGHAAWIADTPDMRQSDAALNPDSLMGRTLEVADGVSRRQHI